MYEDKRSILPSGILSQATKPKYQPSPIKLAFPNTGKPEPTHKNPDKELRRQRRLQQMQMEQQANAGKVICTRYFEWGMIPDDVYIADALFGEFLAATKPNFMKWYHRHAPWWIDMAEKHTWFRRVLWIFVRAWSNQMAHDMGNIRNSSWFGKLLMKLGVLWYRIECRDFHFKMDSWGFYR